jgi:glycosyltransferase involved in cell wall biosynthesis
MRLSVVVCTLNRASLLPRLLTALRSEAAGEDAELVVVDNGSTDDTANVVAAVVAASPDVAIRYVVESERGLSHARNRGFRESVGEIVAYLDDDALPEPGWLAAHQRDYEQDERVGAVGGPIELLFEGERPWWLTDSFEQLLGRYDLGSERRFYDDGEGHHTPSGGNMSFRRSALEEVGLFDPELGRRGDEQLAGEEYELAHRLFHAGWRAVYEPAAAARHLVSPDRLRIGFFRNRMRWNIATSEFLDERESVGRLPLRLEVRNLLAAIGYDAARVVGSKRGGDRLYFLLRLECHLRRAPRLAARTVAAARS